MRVITYPFIVLWVVLGGDLRLLEHWRPRFVFACRVGVKENGATRWVFCGIVEVRHHFEPHLDGSDVEYRIPGAEDSHVYVYLSAIGMG